MTANKASEAAGIDLVRAAQIALDYAAKCGVDESEVSLHHGTGVSVTTRQQDLETVEKHNDAQIVVSVYRDHKTGSASSADLSEAGIQAAVDAAVSIARFTGSDPCLGLADADRMATHAIDLDLYHPWQLDVAKMTDIALKCEAAALAADAAITNSEGATVNSYSGNTVYANSHGFISNTAGSQHSISCSVIGQRESAMQRDYWYDSNRNPSLLQAADEIGRTAARRTVSRLGARQIDSRQAPVMFDPMTAKSLFSHLISALKGGAIYKKASFMLDRVEQQILPDFIHVAEHPHELGAAGSAYHDSEGVATPEKRVLVDQGVLQGYVLGSYTARKLGMASTANAGGVRNLKISNTGHSFEQLLGELGTGLLVTELIGSGINMVTGDYSRGAAGFWVENGVIQYPVEEITIAGNLLQMYQQIVAAGADYDRRGNTECGSIVIESMTIAGS
ncbi:metalloprotease PmbA [Arenicella chitinivorans]|nr:metalloprotease PmbA [Arenicella chitinivorans]